MIEIENIKLFDIDDISNKLNVTPTTIRTYVRKGRIKAIKIRGKLYFSEQNLKAFLLGDVKND